MSQSQQTHPHYEFFNSLDYLLSFEDQERYDIVEKMLQSYIGTLADEYPHYLDELAIYLQKEEHKEEFMQALNNINLVVASTLNIYSEEEFAYSIDKLVHASKNDSSYSVFMKNYYLQSLDIHDLSGIISTPAEFKIIQDRLKYYSHHYSNREN